MAEDFEGFVERVKSATKLEDVVELSGNEFRLHRVRGKHMRGEVHNSLVVVVDEQWYAWNSKGERGDVFNWLENRNHWDFMTSLEWLAERAKIEMPSFGGRTAAGGGGQGAGGRAVARVREDVWGICQRVLSGILWGQEGREALEYCRGRGWSDETIRASGLGFTGRDPAAAVKLIRGELGLYQHDLESKEVVAVTGYRGDVRRWGMEREVDGEGGQGYLGNWVEWGMVPGLVGRARLVYPHLVAGKVRYFSARNIFGSENQDGRIIKSWNVPVALGGKRQVYFNQAYGRRADEVVLVEGQADAITLGQWEVAGVALAGTSWEDHGELLGSLRERHKTVYVCLDNDEAGEAALEGRDGEWPVEKLLGPMCRVIRLSSQNGG